MASVSWLCQCSKSNPFLGCMPRDLHCSAPSSAGKFQCCRKSTAACCREPGLEILGTKRRHALLQLDFTAIPFAALAGEGIQKFRAFPNHAFLSCKVWVPSAVPRRSRIRAVDDRSNGDQSFQDENFNQGNDKVVAEFKDPITRLRGMVAAFPPVFGGRTIGGRGFVLALFVATTVLVISIRAYVVRKSRRRIPGSVADLVRRGQLRSDRRGISTPLKYEDPFNNPLVKVGKSNSTVDMCGKVYRLVPVTLTKEEQAIHQKRRSRAYQWKRPTVFIKEGDSIPPDVDPDTVRWLPANHPFATTASDIDEDLAQNNVYKKHGVPFRIKAEHEALQRKLETLQNEEKFKSLAIDSRNAKDFQRPFNLNAESNDSVVNPRLSGQEHASDVVEGVKAPEERHKS